MWKRIVAAAAGAAVAIGFYLAIDAMAPPPRALTQAAPARASEVKLPPVPVPPVVDPTPARLVIPVIGVDAKVEARGLDSDRNLATASDYRDVAWYDLGPRPG